MISEIRADCLAGGLTTMGFDPYALSSLAKMNECVRAKKVKFGFDQRTNARNTAFNSFFEKELHLHDVDDQPGKNRKSINE